MNRFLDIQDILITPSVKAQTQALLHIAEPRATEENRRGYLVGIAEISSPDKEYLAAARQLLYDLENNYYTTSPDENADTDLFAQALSGLNRRYSALTSPKVEFHCVVACVRPEKITMAVYGSPLALISTKDGQWHNPIDETETPPPGILFSSLIEGALNPNDLIIFLTPKIAEHISRDRWQKLFSTRETTESIAHIKKVLGAADNSVGYGALLVRLRSVAKTNASTPLARPQIVGSSAASLNRMIASERHTAETLSPPFFRQLKNSFKRPPTVNLPRQTGKPAATPDSLLIHIGRIVVTGFLLLFQISRTILSGIWQTILILLILIGNKNNSRHELLARWKNTWEGKKLRLKSLSGLAKIILVVGLIGASLLASKILFTHYTEKTKAATAQFQTQTGLIDQALTDLNAKLIYKDQAGAFAIVNSTEELFRQTNPPTKTDESRLAQLKKDFVSLRTLVLHQTVATSTLVADLGQNFPNEQFSGIALLDDRVIVNNSSSSTLILINRQTGKIETNLSQFGALQNHGTVPKENNLVIYQTKTGLISYSKTDGFVNKILNFPNSEHGLVSDFFIYNARLYTLLPNDNLIYKHDAEQTGFSRGEPWLKEPADLNGAISFAIDGDLYLLKNTGEVQKFHKGLRDKGFQLHDILPALSAPVRLWTYADIPYIYILDKKETRVLLVQKDGSLARQYINSAWKNPTDMAVSTDGKFVYLLDQNKIYSFEVKL